MYADLIFIQNHIDGVCDAIKKWADEDSRLSPSLRDALTQKVQKDLDEYFEGIEEGAPDEDTSSSVEIDDFRFECLTEVILNTIQNELNLEDEECVESEEFEEKVFDALGEVSGEFSYDAIYSEIAGVGVKCAESSFDVSEDQKKSLLRALETQLKEENADGSLEVYYEEECSSSELSLDMDEFSEDEVIRIVRHDIDEILAGDGISEGERMALRGICRQAVQAMCQDLYRMEGYDNLA